MKDYCNDPLACDDFRRTQRELLGAIQIPTNPTRIVLSEKCGEAECGGDRDTSWWQVS